MCFSEILSCRAFSAGGTHLDPVLLALAIIASFVILIIMLAHIVDKH
jgi:hypothetical protein